MPTLNSMLTYIYVDVHSKKMIWMFLTMLLFYVDVQYSYHYVPLNILMYISMLTYIHVDIQSKNIILVGVSMLLFYVDVHLCWRSFQINDMSVCIYAVILCWRCSMLTLYYCYILFYVDVHYMIFMLVGVSMLLFYVDVHLCWRSFQINDMSVCIYAVILCWRCSMLTLYYCYILFYVDVH